MNGPFRYFENLLKPTVPPPEATPPKELGAFYWYHSRQVKGLLIALFVVGSITAVFDAAIPVFIGRLVADGLEARDRARGGVAAACRHGGRAAAPASRHGSRSGHDHQPGDQPGFSNLVRWQNHWHVVRQSWSFFQNDFAGRIANRVMQTGPSLRESVVSGINAVWYILVYGSIALALLAARDWRLAIPVIMWFADLRADVVVFRAARALARKAMSEARSTLTGRIVDSYTNILTVKLFAEPKEEDEFVREVGRRSYRHFRDQLR